MIFIRIGAFLAFQKRENLNGTRPTVIAAATGGKRSEKSNASFAEKKKLYNVIPIRNTRISNAEMKRVGLK